jgi:5-hydroxyisourate hydrolase
MTISAQALDGIHGKPAAGVRARLERAVEGRWTSIANAETDAAGNIDSFSPAVLTRGPYRIVFDSDHYFAGLGLSAAYPEIAVAFRVRGQPLGYQIQVLMTPHSYSMYFGNQA